jgi:hypothetical protein
MQSAPAEHHFSPSSNPPEPNGVTSAQNNPLSSTPTIFPSLPPPNEFFALNNANGIGQNSHVKPHHQPMSIMTPVSVFPRVRCSALTKVQTPWMPIPLQPLTSAHHHHHRGMDNAPRPHPHIVSTPIRTKFNSPRGMRAMYPLLTADPLSDFFHALHLPRPAGCVRRVHRESPRGLHAREDQPQASGRPEPPTQAGRVLRLDAPGR